MNRAHAGLKASATFSVVLTYRSVMIRHILRIFVAAPPGGIQRTKKKKIKRFTIGSIYNVGLCRVNRKVSLREREITARLKSALNPT